MEIIKYGPYTLFTLIRTILTFIVAIEHIGICFLEMFGKPEQQAKAFDMDIINSKFNCRSSNLRRIHCN